MTGARPSSPGARYRSGVVRGQTRSAIGSKRRLIGTALALDAVGGVAPALNRLASRSGVTGAERWFPVASAPADAHNPGAFTADVFGGLFDWLTVALRFAGLRERVGNAPVAEPEAIPG